MKTHRHFLIAPSLARLIRSERGGERVLEGYFADQPQRITFVQIEETRSCLILESEGDRILKEQADVPRAHGQALLAVSHGQVEYVRTRLSIGSHEIQALHFVRPGPLDLVSVANMSEDQEDFRPLPWFGPEVSAEPAYRRRRLALDGAQAAPEVNVTNAALNSLLDLLEDRLSTWPLPGQTAEPDTPATNISARSEPTVPVPETEADEEIDNLGIEDAVIRDLARSLQPRRG